MFKDTNGNGRNKLCKMSVDIYQSTCLKDREHLKMYQDSVVIHLAFKNNTNKIKKYCYQLFCKAIQCGPFCGLTYADIVGKKVLMKIRGCWNDKIIGRIWEVLAEEFIDLHKSISSV